MSSPAVASGPNGSQYTLGANTDKRTNGYYTIYLTPSDVNRYSVVSDRI